MNDIIDVKEDLSQSPLYSHDLAPVPESERTWNKWHLAAIWVGMAVCIPTYILASYMIKSGLDWIEALLIIFFANLIVTLPMVLNGHAGVKYGVPFPVLGRAAFGFNGIHIPALVRGLVACGWFGIQTWIGGLALYAIACAATGAEVATGLTIGKFAGFAIFWLMNIYFIWKVTESIRWLESFAAPILVVIGLALIGWGASKGGGFDVVLQQSAQMEKATAVIQDSQLILSPLTNADGSNKVSEFRVAIASDIELASWRPYTSNTHNLSEFGGSGGDVTVQFKSGDAISSVVTAAPPAEKQSKLSAYLFWLTAMVGFWATMSISIADITRFTKTQKDQITGQFIGLPATMLLYSFVGVFVTCAALIGFPDLLIADDAPWDPVMLLARFENPAVVIIAQFFMIIATLSTNIAANVIAPANAFANLLPKLISFRVGGVITGVIGILIMPWWLLDRISNLLLLVSGFLGPILGVMLADYFIVRRMNLSIPDLFKTHGAYRFADGFNIAAIVALVIGVAVALIGMKVQALSWLYTLSWFTGCGASMLVYVIAMKGKHQPT